MSLRGSHTPGHSSLSVVKSAILFAIALIIFIFLKRKRSLNKSSEIYSLLLSSGLNETLSKFAVSQAAHETAVLGVPFMSKIFLSNNNAFGMKYAGQVNAQSEKNGYAYYKNVSFSVADFVAWYTRHRLSLLSLPLYIGSLTSYVRFLKNNNYFEAAENEYLKGVTHFYNELFG